MTHRNTNIAQNRAIGKVALQTAHGKFLRKELQQGVGNAQVSLTIFEINRVYFVRHSTRPYLACFDLLLEILHRDIHPEVAVEVDDDRIEAADGIEDSGQRIIVADLSRELFTLQAKLFANKLIGKRAPVVVGIGYVMCVQITCCATELCRQRTILQGLQLLGQTIDIYHHFLSKTCRRCRLTVSLCQHGNRLPFFCILAQLIDKLLELGNKHIRQSLFQRKGHTRVINVLRGKTKVDKFLIGSQ